MRQKSDIFPPITSAMLFVNGYSKKLLTAIVIAAFPLCALAMDLPPSEAVETPSAAVARRHEVERETDRLLKAQDIDGLEAMASQLRKSRESEDNGVWILSAFYANAADVPDDAVGEKKWMDFLERWVRERPNSITARICLAQALAVTAWHIPSNGKSSTARKHFFGERLAEAQKVLDEAALLSEKCPGWVDTEQLIALGQAWNQEDYLAMTAKALAQEPTFCRYYSRAFFWLSPTWYGKEGDYEKWLTAQADAAPPDQRDKQYARLVILAESGIDNSDFIFAPGRLDWSRTKRGLEALLKEQPDNLPLRFEYTQFAVLADDRIAARTQFEITGGKFYPSQWRSTAQFEKARKFAFSNGANPLVKKDEPAPQKPKSLDWAKWIFKILSGFSGGLLAGTCLLLLALQRKQPGAGVIALIACILAATFLGTPITIAVGGLLFLYLKRKNLPQPPETEPPSWWAVLLWIILLLFLYLGLQSVAALLAIIPLLMEMGTSNPWKSINTLLSNGTAFLICINGAWITFLALITICRPQSREGWNQRLGLSPTPVLRGLLWCGLAIFALVGMHFAFHSFTDERTRNALKYLTLGVHSPFVFFMAIAFVAPVVEELIFRGYAYSGWIQKLGFWGAAIVTSVLFAICHFQYGYAGLAHVFLIGMVLVSLRWKTGSIYPSIALHMLNNLFFCVTVYLHTIK
ncbi:MAG: CPBP family intramembrane glutamic endopeptidase [Chthoniobacterales bacterium]